MCASTPVELSRGGADIERRERERQVPPGNGLLAAPMSAPASCATRTTASCDCWPSDRFGAMSVRMDAQTVGSWFRPFECAGTQIFYRARYFLVGIRGRRSRPNARSPDSRTSSGCRHLSGTGRAPTISWPDHTTDTNEAPLARRISGGHAPT